MHDSKHSAATTVEELNLLDMVNSRVFFKSQFQFLRQHNGLRPRCMHTILGTSGGGKSTLTRAIIWDILLSGHKVGIVLSEETKSDFIQQLAKQRLRLEKVGVSIEQILASLFVFSEQENLAKEKTALAVIEEVYSFAKKEAVDVLIYDNVTTSRSYADQFVSVQGDVARALKQLAASLEIPVIIVAHTTKRINDGNISLIDMQDIRGSSAIPNLSEYFYVLQSFKIGERRLQTLRLVKSRHHDVTSSLFTLNYSKESRLFVGDEPIPFSEFKEKFRMRNRT